jgi:hypothetical protein
MIYLLDRRLDHESLIQECLMESISTPTYSSMLSSKGALLDETLAVLKQIDHGHSPGEVRSLVMDHDLLGKMTTSTRQSVWDHIHARYLSDGDHAHVLAHMVVHAPDRQTERLVLFYEFCRSTPVLRDVTIQCVYPRYATGYIGIDKTIIQQHFDEVSGTHPELIEWSPQTRDKVVSNILTTLRDFGLLEGSQRKQFSRLYVPLPAFVYVLYRLAEDGLKTPQEILDFEDWRLFFLEPADVVTLLDEATAAGHCTFKHRGDVYSLDLSYPSLEACVEALTGEI